MIARQNAGSSTNVATRLEVMVKSIPAWECVTMFLNFVVPRAVSLACRELRVALRLRREGGGGPDETRVDSRYRDRNGT